MAKILIVDDSASDREIFSKVLEDAGHDVTTLSSPISAYLEVPTTIDADIILVDLLLESEDGYAVAKKLRRKAPDARIAIFSGIARYGKDGFPLISKDLSHAEIVEAVEYL